MNNTEKKKQTPTPTPAQPKKAAVAVAEPKQNRLKSWALWAGILGSVWLIMSALGLPEKIGLTNESFNTIVSAVGSILTLLGIVNNPTNPAGI